MSASGGLPMKIHGQDGRATTGVWRADSLPTAMKLSINMDVTALLLSVQRPAIAVCFANERIGFGGVCCF